MLPVHHHYPRSLGRSAVSKRCAGTPALRGRRLPARSHRGAGLRNAAAGLCCLVAALALGACSSEPKPFPGSASSLDELAQSVLTALSEGDREALESVRLSEYEHNEVIWPEQPAARPEIGFPVAQAWMNITLRNNSALSRIARTYRGRTPVYRDVECRGRTQTFDTFHALRDCWVVFQWAEGEPLLEAQLFKSVVVRGGGYKIIRYDEEEPRQYRGSSEMGTE